MVDIHYLEYPIHESGYIHNWLTAGPQASPITQSALLAEPDAQSQIILHYHREGFDLHEPPLELNSFEMDGLQLTWQYFRCREDHWVDLSQIYSSPHYVRAWAYAEINVPEAVPVNWTLTSSGPTDVWINRQRVCTQTPCADLEETPFSVTLNPGTNPILVRFETAALDRSHLAMSLRITDAPIESIRVRLPVPHSNMARRLKLERTYQELHVEHPVLLQGENLLLRWDDQLDEIDDPGFWVQDPHQHIQAMGSLEAKPSEQISIGHRQFILNEGPYQVALFPPAHVIERNNILYREFLPFHVLETPYSTAYYGDDTQRRHEGLTYASRRTPHLYAEIARLALGSWGTVDQAVLEEAVRRIHLQQPDSILDLIGLLGVMYRHPQTPAISASLRQVWEAAAVRFSYPAIETPARQMLKHTGQILLGQLYPDRLMAADGQTGHQQREQGEQQALAWLHECAARGFADWNSPQSVNEMVVALSHLADLAKNQEVCEWAAIVLDKLFFTLAVNSFQGIWGTAHRHTQTAALKSDQLSATTGLSRLLWGAGVWNHHITGLVSLACSGYELPTMIASIAVHPTEEMWHRERHPDVSTATYRTPDHMLCAALDYRTGQPGQGEHIWQATLGPDTLIFVNHPARMSESDAHLNNLWRGNGVLPRVAQWKDTLIAFYQLPADDRLGFTHAHFPIHELDEYRLDGRWAFGRRGSGYVTLMASQDLHLITRGPTAFRELRASGACQTWLCLMGQQAQDGDFAAFQDKVQSLSIRWDGQNVDMQTLRGDTLSFSRSGPLLVNGQEQPLICARHYDGPHGVADWPARQMDICYGDYTLRLELGF